MELNEFFQQNPRAALAFSGGVDSACLLAAGLRAGADVRPYFIQTPFQPAFERADARRLCRELGAELTVLELDVLSCPGVAENGPDRCYRCKRALFTALKERSSADGYDLLLDGSNAGDDPADRPGMRALTELGVRSPLRECGLAKAEIRLRSRELGLFTWDKPSYACLATRVPTGRAITPELLEKAEGAEQALFDLGFTDFRVRLYHDAARIQLPEGQLGKALEQKNEILHRLKPWFEAVLLDLETR